MVQVILTVWKRSNLEEQIHALLNQTLTPERIWIYHCCDFIDPDPVVVEKHTNISYQFNTSNLGYFGRFSLGLIIPSPYLFIADDDVIPSADWLQKAVACCDTYNAIIASSGRIVPLNNFRPEQNQGAQYLADHFIGDSDAGCSTNKCSEDTPIDYGCNSWLIKTEWLHYFWSIKPYTLQTGEDMHLSASCYLKEGIITICPQQGEQSCGNLKKLYGFDSFASWKTNDFINRRESVLQYLINECGWRPMKWKGVYS